jgi:hypothetical protein
MVHFDLDSTMKSRDSQNQTKMMHLEKGMVLSEKY